MIRDVLGVISPSFSLVTADAGTGSVTSVGDVLDLNQARDIAGGEPLALHVKCLETVVVGGFANATFMVVASNDASLAVAPLGLGAMVFAFPGFDAVRAGDRFVVPFGPGFLGGDNPATTGMPGTLQVLYAKRYLGVSYINQPRTILGAGSSFTGGRFSLEILPWAAVDKGSRIYGGGFAIT